MACKEFLDLEGLKTFWSIVKQYIDTPTSTAQVEMTVVSELPEVGIPGVIYFVANDSSTNEEDVYDEYVYVSDRGAYEKLGTFYNEATTSEAGLMSASDKAKLDEIEEGAEANQNAFTTVAVSNYKGDVGTITHLTADSTTDTLHLVAGDNITLTATESSDSVAIAATDTTYDEATTSEAGLMSADDKAKLDEVEAGAEVNQNAFTTVAVSNYEGNVGTITNLTADSTTDTLHLVAGDNITLTATESSDSVTIAATIAATDTTYDEATTSEAGLMSADDKAKLDEIEVGAEVNQNAFTTVAVSNYEGDVGTLTNLTADSATDTLHLVAGDNITLTATESSDTVSIAATDTTYDEATTSEAGLMSASDKAKLDGITEGADSVSVSATATSGNTVGVITVNGTATTLYSGPITGSSDSGSTGSTVSYSASVTDGTTLGTLTIDGTDTDIVAPDAAMKFTNASGSTMISTTNTSTYLSLYENDTIKSSLQIRGSGSTSVWASNGVLTIGSTVDLSTYYTIDEVNALIDALREELSGDTSSSSVTFTAVTVISVTNPGYATTADLDGTTLTYYLGSDGCMYTRPTASSSYYAEDGYYAATSYGFYVEDGTTDYDYTKLTRKVYIVNSGVYSITNVTWSVE